MFEVFIIKMDGSKETYDCLEEMQAECIFFRARKDKDTKYVELNELVDVE